MSSCRTIRGMICRLDGVVCGKENSPPMDQADTALQRYFLGFNNPLRVINLSVQAVEFLYGMRAVYPTAERVWQEQGIYHYTHRMTLRDFTTEIVNRIPHSWHEGLNEHVEYLYMTVSLCRAFMFVDDLFPLMRLLRHRVVIRVPFPYSMSSRTIKSKSATACTKCQRRAARQI